MPIDDAETRRRLAAWLDQTLPGAQGVEVGPLTATSTGFSAQTLMFDASYDEGGVRRERALVMRKEMPGPPVFRDTDLRRQGEMMAALTRHGIPTSPLIGIEDDEALLGARFLVTERVTGRALPAGNYNLAGWLFDLPSDQQGQVWRGAISTIGRMNRCDWRDGFASQDKPQYGPAGLGQYLGWMEAWRAECGGGAPNRVVDAALAYLRRAQPDNLHVDVLWGDSNPGNMLFADDLSVAAALDFEAAALGPGEIDLGWWLFMDERRSFGLKRLEGLPDRAQTVAIYEAALGRAVADVDYYVIAGGLKMSLVIVRTIDRLIEMGLLAPGNTGGLHNPMAAALARMLGIEAPETGEDYGLFVKAVSQR